MDPVLPWRLGAAVARAVPAPVGRLVATAAGAAVSTRPSERRRMLERHLRRALGPDVPSAVLARRVRAAFGSYGRYWFETFRTPGVSTDELHAGMSVEGRGHIEAALAAGRGAVVALPHLGGWEWAGAFIARDGDPITVVVEALEPPEVFEWFAGLRRDMGMRVVPAGPGAGRAVVQALRANHVVCLLSDRDLHGGGVEVEFFGERTTLPAGPATVALRTGAPILPTAVYFEGGRHRGVVRPPLDTARRGDLRSDVSRITQDLARELEALIRRAPEQWHLLQPNWPSDREPPP